MPYLYVIRLSPYTKLPFSLLPETITVSTANSFQSYDVMGIGEVLIPKGQKVKSVSWKGLLPGPSRMKASCIHSEEWIQPISIINQLEHWRCSYLDVRVLLTQSAINYVMKIKSFTFKPIGAHGDYEYEIALVEKKDIQIRTLPVKKKKGKKISSAAKSKKGKAKRVITTVKGDTLYRVALRELGDGTRYTEIKKLNKSKLGRTAVIPAGTKLTLP